MTKIALATLSAAALLGGSLALAAPADKNAATDALIQERQQIQPRAQAEQDALLQERGRVGAHVGTPGYVAPRAVKPVRRVRRPVRHTRVVHHATPKPAPPPHH